MPTIEVTSEDVGRAKAGHRPHKRLLALLALLVLCVLGACLYLVHAATKVQASLQHSMDSLSTLQEQVLAGEFEAAKRTSAELQSSASIATENSTSPLWRAAGYLPIVGDNFSAIKEVSVSLNDVVDRAILPMANSLESIEGGFTVIDGGRVNLELVEQLAPTLRGASTTVDLSYERINGIDTEHLLPQISEPLAEAESKLDVGRKVLANISSAANIVPSMLGGDEPRNYLVMVQNLSETRATGGIPGALAVLRAEAGQLSLKEQDSAAALGPFQPAMSIDPEQEAIYTSRLGIFMQNVNLTPNFPTAASTAASMWEERHPGSHIDGAIALDPLVLAHLLEATGPVDLATSISPNDFSNVALPTTLTSDNVVSTLLSDVYARIEDPAIQDQYFAAVAAQIFSTFTTDISSTEDLVAVVDKSVNENRILIWSSKADEQSVLSNTTVGGSATGPSVGGATFGLYFNDGTGAKMDYYIRRSAQLVQQCSSDGYSTYTVRVTIKNTAPLDAAVSLPPYVTGGGIYGVPPGSVRTNYVVYGPAQSLVGAAEVDDVKVPIAAYRHGQRAVGIVSLELGPGESKVLETSFFNVVQSSAPQLQVTPTIQPKSEVLLPLIRDESCL